MLRSGLIGLGRMAWGYDGGRYINGRSLTHASCLDRHKRTELVLGYDPSGEARAAFTAATGIEATGDLDAFLAARHDFIAIASPSEFHFLHARSAIASGARYIWLEKPPALSLDDHHKLIGLAERSPVRIGINYFRRNLPQYRALTEQMTGGLVAIQVDYSRGLAINGVHLLDQIGALLPGREAPKPDWVIGRDRDNPSFGFMLADVEVTVSGLNVPYHCIDIRAITRDARLSVRRGGLEAVIEKRKENAAYPGFFHLSESENLVESALCKSALQEASFRNLENLVDDDTTLVSSLSTSLFATQVLARVQEAIR